MDTSRDNEMAEFVRRGYHDASQHFVVAISCRTTLEAALRAAGPYNEFHPEAVLNALDDLLDHAMSIEFGREGSPVMYVHLPFWTHQRFGQDRAGERRKYTDAGLRAHAEQVLRWGRDVGADERSTIQFPGAGKAVWNASGEHPRCVRLWWD